LCGVQLEYINFKKDILGSNDKTNGEEQNKYSNVGSDVSLDLFLARVPNEEQN
jgi:hypothetical protein